MHARMRGRACWPWVLRRPVAAGGAAERDDSDDAQTCPSRVLRSARAAQVERLSMMTEMTPDRILAAETALRLDVINSTVNIDTRLVKLYELVENDLLGALTLSSHYIAPYKARPAGVLRIGLRVWHLVKLVANDLLGAPALRSHYIATCKARVADLPRIGSG